jgi:tetratricopeptide (TPR) repeat protein
MTLSLLHPRRLAVLAIALAVVTAALALLMRTPGPGPAPAPQAVGAAALAPGASTEERIAALQRAARDQPRSAPAATALAQAYLQRARETGDPSWYVKADGLLDRARRLSPRDPAVLAASGTLALARHDFRGALRDGEAARRAAPDSTLADPVLVDALVELGRYGAAAAALQRSIDAKPTLAGYARASYLRELRGDLAGAAEAMRLAVAAGSGAAENVAYVGTLLGDLELRRGRRDAARRAYREALAVFSGHVPAQAGLARVDAAAGRLDAAIDRLRPIVGRLPLPEYVVALGETQLAAGQRAEARRTLALVGAQERLLQAAGVNTDVDLALFEAEHGAPRRAVALARAGWAQAPSVRSADALAAALTAAGRGEDALRWSNRALRLGWREPTVLEHAARAAHAAGRYDLARARVRAALRGADALSPWRAARARRLEASL